LARAGEKGPAPVSLSATDGVLVNSGRLVLPAVKGNPAAAYFTVSNQSGAVATLTGVEVAHAGKAEMHVTLDGIMEAVPKLDIGSGKASHSGRAANMRWSLTFRPDCNRAAQPMSRWSFPMDARSPRR
jgi:hypothetical protein